MAEWITVGLIALGMVASLSVVLVRIAINISKNTDAIERLTEYIEKQEEKMDKINGTLSEHGERISALESVRGLRRRKEGKE